MIHKAIDISYLIFNNTILVYALVIVSIYLMLAILSVLEMRRYMKKNYFVDYRTILSSPLSPSISLIAPAYDEGMTVIDNVKSLLAIQYNNYEVIVVNDGSRDDSMKKLIEAYNLVKVPFAVNYNIKTREILGVYKSANRAYKKLTVVDKVNGGKADALNAGLNISDNDLVACIDVDSIIEPDSLLKMVKPFLEESTRVIATGGVVRIANSCVVEEGRLIEVKLPESLLARFQVLEYIRAFLLGRMAWTRLNGLLLISGAFGLFDKEIAIKCGGYSTNTVGEDMELVVRMRRYMHEHKMKYKVVYIPDPLCWTEAPSNNTVLGKQRNRWARGTFETLKIHKGLFMNPKYGLMGMFSYPFWLLFEWLAPFVEFSGILFFIILVILGKVNWAFFLSLLLAVYAFAIFLSMFSLLAEETSFYKYTEQKDIFKMIGIAFIEPFVYHPRNMFWSLKGSFDLYKGKKSWGEMTRKGFVQYKSGS